MPAFSGQFDWATGLVWQVGVIAGEELPKHMVLHMCPALVDTGASETCIANSVVQALKLEPSGKIDMQHARGITPVNVYDVQVAFIRAGMPDKKGLVSGEVEVIASIRAPEFNPGNNPYQALVGRDILRKGALSLTFDGHYSFAY
jgi:hypothetical protein